MANALGLDRCATFPICHAFIDCDTMSCFGSSGKRIAWDMWSAYDEVTPAFCTLAATPENVDHWLCPLERLLVLLYDCTSTQEFVNGTRKQSIQKGRAIVLRHKQYLYSSSNSGILKVWTKIRFISRHLIKWRTRRSTKVTCHIFHNSAIGCPNIYIYFVNKITALRGVGHAIYDH